MHHRSFFYTIKQYRAVLVFCLAAGNAISLHAQEASTRHLDGVLGTSLDFTVQGVGQQQAGAAFAVAEQEIQRLEQLLSTWRDDSELVQLNTKRSTAHASPELLDVVRLCQLWRERSLEKFSCRLGRVLALWEQAEQDQLLPERADVRQVARSAATAAIGINAAQSSIVLDPGISLDPSGLAKGYIIDRALAVLKRELPDATAIKVDIGGDAVYWGTPQGQTGWRVALANPVHTADNSGYLAQLSLHSMAVAASGHTSRTREIGRRSFSHILDPRDGWPLENATSAVVLAADAVSADAVATALTVLPMLEGIEWVNTLDGIEALVIDSAGRQLHSQQWLAYLDTSSLDTSAVPLAPVLELAFALPEFSVASYNRPYVAIWITDPEQKPLKNLLLLGETERWARENTRWWRRVGRRNPDLLDGVARPTRGPGEYQLAWDGRDDFGNVVTNGDYLLHIEASRENGDSSYQSLRFTLGQAGSQQLEPDGEIGTVVLTINQQ